MTASYAADEALLRELRGQWPPRPSPFRAGLPDGYVPIDVDARPPGAALRLHGERFAVAMVPDGDSWLPIPIAGSGGRWWRAAAGDGLSSFVAGVPMASERPLGVDQTNLSVVVGERVIVKWFRRIGPDPGRAATLIAHLDAVGFTRIPRPLGSLTWRAPGGVELAFAQGDEWLSGARDGWDWAVERVDRATPDAATTGRQLGTLASQLHAALATPSRVIAEPATRVPAATAASWRAAAEGLFHDAMSVTPEVSGLGEAIRRDLDRLPSDRPIRVQPVHGDFHVGQVLEWPGGLAVIDFDGNPALGPTANELREPVERDVAQMLSSLDHVGRVVEHRRPASHDPAVAEWVHVARDAFLAAYGPVDPDVLAAFEAEQELRELVYAARFLPRWRYAPVAALRARYGS